MGAVDSRHIVDLLCFAKRRQIKSQGPREPELSPFDSSGSTSVSSRRWSLVLPTRSTRLRTLLEITCARNLPKMDVASPSDPYVEARVLRREASRCSMRVFPYALNTSTPVWGLRRILGAPLSPAEGAAADDQLELQVWDLDDACTSNICGADYIGTARISAEEIEAAGWGNLITLPLRLGRKGERRQRQDATCPEDRTVTISLRCWPTAVFESWPKAKWIFIIRHGESKWNVAERSMWSGHSISTMLRKVDHSLSVDGVRQASELAERIRLWSETCCYPPSSDAPIDVFQRFLDAEAIFASPFTRAVQTALVALHTHPGIQNGIKLRAELRETKNLAGRDTIGCRQGVAIVQRAREELHAVLHKMRYMPDSAVDELRARVDEINIDPGNTEHEWWDELAESSRSIHIRLRELLVLLKLSSHSQVILVGHSLLTRELLRHYLTPECRAANPVLTDHLRKHKLPNCAVLALRADFRLPVAKCIDTLHMLSDSPVSGWPDMEDETEGLDD